MSYWMAVRQRVYFFTSLAGFLQGLVVGPNPSWCRFLFFFFFSLHKVTCRGMSIPLVSRAFAMSWGVAGTRSRVEQSITVKLNWGLLTVKVRIPLSRFDGGFLQLCWLHEPPFTKDANGNRGFSSFVNGQCWPAIDEMKFFFFIRRH